MKAKGTVSGVLELRMSPEEFLMSIASDEGLRECQEAETCPFNNSVARLESLSSGFHSQQQAGNGVDVKLDPSIVAFDDFMSQFISRISPAAEKICGQVLDATKVIVEAFSVQRELLVKMNQSQKPDLAGLANFLKTLNEVIMKANALTEGKRYDPFNHLKATAGSLLALTWIAYSGKYCMSLPIAHVEESWQMDEFYNKKVFVEYRNKDPNHAEWAKALKELYLPSLRDYVKSFYPLGIVWSSAGTTNTTTAPTSAPTKASPQRTPAPPPPPPASLFSCEPTKTSSSHPKEGMFVVFQEISSGKPMILGSRKITDDMKTKNCTDRTGVIGSSGKGTLPSVPSFSKAGPPKLELQMGRKWVVENQIGRKNLVIDDCDAKQSMYIFGCKDSLLQFQGKGNNITVDKSTKMGIMFTDVVASCEIVNCNGVKVQCQGSAPTISVDNTAGCELYLSKASLQTSITTKKSSEINVLVPGAGVDDDWAEHLLPQQFVHVYKEGQFVTSPVSHSGG